MPDRLNDTSSVIMRITKEVPFGEDPYTERRTTLVPRLGDIIGDEEVVRVRWSDNMTFVHVHTRQTRNSLRSDGSLGYTSGRPTTQDVYGASR